MYELSRVTDLLNPCRFTDTVRQQAYTQAQLSDVGPPGGQLRFSLPNNTTLDLSDAYIDLDLVSVGGIPEVAMVFNISRTVAAPLSGIAGGSWQLLYDGSSVGGVDNANLVFRSNTPIGNSAAPAPGSILYVINNYYKFKGRGYLATSTNAATDTLVTASDINITISRFGGWGGPPIGWSVSSALISAAGPPIVPVMLSIDGFTLSDASVLPVMETPLVEKTLPIFNRVYIQVNGTTVFDVQGANRLYSALQFLDTEFDSIGKLVEDAYNENGTPFTPRGKFRFFLNWIDLFQSLFPMDILPNAQIILYLDLELPNLALVCATQLNNPTQSYRIQNAKIKYHTLQLSDSDKSQLRGELNTNGLTIPFLNWVYFADTIPNGTVNKQAIFNPSVSNLLGVLFVMVNQDYYADARNVRKLSTFLRNNMNSYRLKIGNFYFPQDKVEVSNTYYSIAEQARELILLTEVINRKPIVDDMEVFSNFAGTQFGVGGNIIGNDPTDVRYVPWFENVNHMKSVYGIATCDLGFAEKTKLCERIALHGVDTSVLPNVVLELEGMSVDGNCDLNIYSLSQDYLTFYSNKFVWKH